MGCVLVKLVRSEIETNNQHWMDIGYLRNAEEPQSISPVKTHIWNILHQFCVYIANIIRDASLWLDCNFNQIDYFSYVQVYVSLRCTLHIWWSEDQCMSSSDTSACGYCSLQSMVCPDRTCRGHSSPSGTPHTCHQPWPCASCPPHKPPDA